MLVVPSVVGSCRFIYVDEFLIVCFDLVEEFVEVLESPVFLLEEVDDAEFRIVIWPWDERR